jgi:hypothetical protein
MHSDKDPEEHELLHMLILGAIHGLSDRCSSAITYPLLSTLPLEVILDIRVMILLFGKIADAANPLLYNLLLS